MKQINGGENASALVAVASNDNGAQRLESMLHELFVRFTQDSGAIEPGMLVQWKPGMSNRRGPSYGQPVIAMEVLEKPIIDDRYDSGSLYFREPLDLLIGILDDDGDFVILHVDRRRFQRYIGIRCASGE